jgi:predicted Ser/Thr protein kinase
VTTDAANNNQNDSFESNKRQFTYSEVLKITNKFQRILGKGGFGTVYHGYIDRTEVAVKMLSPSSAQGYREFQTEACTKNSSRTVSSIIDITYLHIGQKYDFKLYFCRSNFW